MIPLIPRPRFPLIILVRGAVPRRRRLADSRLKHGDEEHDGKVFAAEVHLIRRVARQIVCQTTIHRGDSRHVARHVPLSKQEG